VESTPHAKPLKHQHRHRANEQTGNWNHNETTVQQKQRTPQ
jgi:hypothetical protein